MNDMPEIDVDRLMERLFPLLGYHNIQDLHVSTYKQFLDAARPSFDLVHFKSMPTWVPPFAGLYFAMLFRKSLAGFGDGRQETADVVHAH